MCLFEQPQLLHNQSMVDVLQTFDGWFSHSGCITAVVESGVLLKALRALRYVLMRESYGPILIMAQWLHHSCDRIWSAFKSPEGS